MCSYRERVIASRWRQQKPPSRINGQLVDFVFRDLLFIVFYAFINFYQQFSLSAHLFCVCACGFGFKTFLCSFTMNLFSVALFKLTKFTMYLIRTPEEFLFLGILEFWSYRTQMEVHSSGLCDSLFGCVHISTESICTRKTLLR